MFMVASSVVTTIMVLDYHHRLVDTHEMPDWVGKKQKKKEKGKTVFFLQVQIVFLQWLPWLLHMSRPGEKITRKSIQMQKKMKELDKKEIASKSLLANVLDMEDDIHHSAMLNTVYPYHPSHVKPVTNNVGITLTR